MTDEQFMKFMSTFMGNQQQQAPIDLAGLAKVIHPGATHLGIGGQEITQDNPMGNPGGNPFANGFFKSAPLTPEARIASSGPTAENQWGVLGGLQGVDPTALQHMNTLKEQVAPFSKLIHQGQEMAGRPLWQDNPAAPLSPWGAMLGAPLPPNPGFNAQGMGNPGYSAYQAQTELQRKKLLKKSPFSFAPGS